MKRLVWVLASVSLFVVSSVSPAEADLLFFSPTGVVSEMYDGPTHPVPVGDGGFRLTFHGGGSKELVDPLLLILGIPTGELAPTIGLGANDGFTAASIDLGGTTTSYGGNWNTTTGYAGTFTQAGHEVYSFMNLGAGANDSQNYSNWNGTSGLTSWDLYVWAITLTPDMQSTNPDWIEFTGSFSANTYAIGYGCQTGRDGLCSDKVQSTPFTRAGFVTTVPEPSSLMMMLPGLAMLAGAVRRRKKKV
jgi:hypothetical protein